MANLPGTGRALGLLQSNLSDIDSLQMNAGGTVGFYGATPVTQRAAANQAASVVSASTYITVPANLAAFAAEVAATLTGVGLWKGGA